MVSRVHGLPYLVADDPGASVAGGHAARARVGSRDLSVRCGWAIDRYRKEWQRLFDVLNAHLSDNQFVAGKYSIADIASWCWVRTQRWPGLEIDDLPHLYRWRDAIGARSAAARGVTVPADVPELVTEKSERATLCRRRGSLGSQLGVVLSA